MPRIPLLAGLLIAGPCPNSTQPIRRPLLGDATFPEGIAAHPGTGTLFVGGLASGDIQRLTHHGPGYFKSAHEDGLDNVIGLAVDAERDRLWVCSSSFDDPTVPASVFVFDTNTGEVLVVFTTPADGLPHFLNDVDVDSNGHAYVTDSFVPVVWTVDTDLEHMTPLVSDPAFVVDPMGFNLNGIAVTPGDQFAIVAVPTLSGVGGKLFRIALDDASVLEIALDPDFGSVDGLTVLDDTTMLGSGGVPGLHVLAFDDGFTSVAVTSMDQFEDDLDLPTTAAVLGERVWVVNSQLDHFVDLFDNDEPPELPFAVVGIPTSLLGE